MASSALSEPLDAESVWQRVRKFAEERRVNKQPIYTLQKQIENTIQHVGVNTIVRRSTAGRENTAHIEYGHIETIWGELRDQGYSSTSGKPRVFAHALLKAAMPESIGSEGNQIFFLDSPPASPDGAPEGGTTVDYAMLARRGWGRGGGGEGAVHRGIRLYIYECPNEALAGLRGGPWTPYDTECRLATKDRIDVVVHDGEGRVVLIEVKRELCSDLEYSQYRLERTKAAAISPFAQAAKYRTQWHILYGSPLESLRCVVAAPQIPTELAGRMERGYQIESVAVTLPNSGPYAASE
jgi:hypothetical protein